MAKSATDSDAERAPPRLFARGNGWLGTFDAMASRCEVHFGPVNGRVAAETLDAVAREAWRIEAKFSRYRSDSIVAAINNGGGTPVRVDDETARLLDYAQQVFELSGGKFDITSGALRRVWRFEGSGRVPSVDEVRRVLVDVGWSRAVWRAPVITLPAGMEIDFGGIGKEYAVDRAAALVESSVPACLINFGGDLRATAPDAPGRPWRVGIEAVDRQDAADRIVELAQGALATSGDTRRFLLKEGRRYGHILDPTTGWPIRDPPRSVTVLAGTCTQAGMLATLAILYGRDAEVFLAAQGVRHWCTR